MNLVRRVGRGGAKVILDSASLSILPGEFVALVGGSGAGKTTLLRALCAVERAQTGLVLFNGLDFYRNPGPYREMIGYVPQDDILHRELTVDRALHYAALLRLPPDTSSEERAKHIEEALAEVKMEAQRHQPISKLSDGQRKRVSIAVELLANPGVIFLDEPTSGLDPGLDKTVMALLQLLCDRGRTIVLVTHATENICLCSHVAFMARGGRLVYFGPPPRRLPLSAFLPSRISTRCANSGQRRPVSSKRGIAGRHTTSVRARPPAGSSRTDRDGRRGASIRRLSVKAGACQWWILTRRYAELLGRDRLNLAILLAQAPVVALLLIMVASQCLYRGRCAWDATNPADADAGRRLVRHDQRRARNRQGAPYLPAGADGHARHRALHSLEVRRARVAVGAAVRRPARGGLFQDSPICQPRACSCPPVLRSASRSFLPRWQGSPAACCSAAWSPRRTEP